MDKNFLEECLAEGMSLEAIGKRVGKHESTVSYWLKKHGLEAVGAERHAPKGGLSKAELAPLVAEGLTIERIAQRLGVGDGTARRWLQRHGLRTRAGERRVNRANAAERGEREFEAVCVKHGRTRHVMVKSEQRTRCAKCRSEAVSKRRRRVKALLVEEAGGRCVLCGYDQHLAALQFHHLDPTEKSFSLGVRGITRSLALLRAEAAKCVLLCANCHAEVEADAVELPLELQRKLPEGSPKEYAGKTE
jgi:transposase